MKSRRNKGYKIQKYDRIFDGADRRRKKRIRNTVIVAIVLAVLIFLGYSVSGPFINLLKGEKTPSKGENSSSDVSSVGSNVGGISSQITSSSLAESEKEESKKIYAIKLPVKTAQDENALSQFLGDAKRLGYTSVIVELKDENGTVHFVTKNEIAQSVKAVSASALDAKKLCQTIKDADLVPIAQIHAFKDKTATKNRDARIKYAGNEGWSWFDAKNGKPWLNPYSQVAQSYVTSLATELAEQGYENVMVSSVMFPAVKRFVSADFGELEKTVSHKDVLSQYTASLKKELNQKGAKLILSYSVAYAQKEDNLPYGGANPADFDADIYAPDFGAGVVSFGSEQSETASGIASSETNIAQEMTVSGTLSEFANKWAIDYKDKELMLSLSLEISDVSTLDEGILSLIKSESADSMLFIKW